MPDLLLPDESAGAASRTTSKHLARLNTGRWGEINDDQTILMKMQHSAVLSGFYNSLEQREHWQHASTRYKQGASLEQSHNQVHVALGHPMSTISLAAFYPAFFFHHCNIDRIYESYLEIEGAVECKREFISKQRENFRRGDRNRYTEGGWVRSFAFIYSFVASIIVAIYTYNIRICFTILILEYLFLF